MGIWFFSFLHNSFSEFQVRFLVLIEENTNLISREFYVIGAESNHHTLAPANLPSVFFLRFLKSGCSGLTFPVYFQSPSISHNTTTLLKSVSSLPPSRAFRFFLNIFAQIYCVFWLPRTFFQ